MAQKTDIQEISIASAILKKKISLRVQVPEGYRQSKQQYAVLYVLNGGENAVSEMAASAKALHQESGTAEMIVVGVENDGDVAKFFSCMEKEIIPAIAKRYRSSLERILHGRDSKGSQVLYALLTKPTLFNGYISATRQWQEDGKGVYTDLAEKAFKNPARYKGKKFFFAWLNGAYENSNPQDMEKQMQQFSDLLVAKSGKRIACQYKAFDNWGGAVRPDFKECLLFVAPKIKKSGPLEKIQLANGKWVIRNSKKEVLCEIFPFDNGPDYPSEGLFRIVKNGKIGYADEYSLAIVIAAQYDCAFPFESGKAKVSNKCQTKKIDEYEIWESEDWQYINKQGKVLKQGGAFGE